MDIHGDLTITFYIPELEAINLTLRTIGERIVGEISGIQGAIDRLVANQLAGQEQLSAHLSAIQDEIAQLGANPTQEQLDHLAAQVNAAADTAAKGVEDLKVMTEQVKGMVPDTPA